MPEQQPPFSPAFASAQEKVLKAEDAWNSGHPEAVALAYTPNSF